MNRFKVAIIGLGAAASIGAVGIYRSFDRADQERRHPAVVDTTPPETAAAPVEPLDPVAQTVPVEPTAHPAEPPPTPAPRAAPAVREPVPPEDPALPDDTAILAKLHELAASDPEQSLQLARAALERFPSSPSAGELEWNVVKALFNMGRLDDAKDEARTMVRNYPDSDFTGDVERHLLNPQPNQ